MKKKIITALHLDDPASLKRLLTTLVSAVTLLALNPFLSSHGLNTIDDTTIVTVAGLVMAYVLQSGVNSAVSKSADAKVDAVKVDVVAPVAVEPEPLQLPKPTGGDTNLRVAGTVNVLGLVFDVNLKVGGRVE